MKYVHILLGTLTLLVGCGKNTSDNPKSVEEAFTIAKVATQSDLARLKEIWGVDSPDSNAFLGMSEVDLMLLVVKHDRLRPYEQSIQRDWQPVNAATVIRHERFIVNGSTDKKARFTKWKGEDGWMRYIVLDYSTGIISYFRLSE